MNQIVCTYKLLEEGKAIQCLWCGLVSHIPSDVAEHYCGACHRFHDLVIAKAVRLLNQAAAELLHWRTSEEQNRLVSMWLAAAEYRLTLPSEAKPKWSKP